LCEFIGSDGSQFYNIDRFCDRPRYRRRYFRSRLRTGQHLTGWFSAPTFVIAVPLISIDRAEETGGCCFGVSPIGSAPLVPGLRRAVALSTGAMFPGSYILTAPAPALMSRGQYRAIISTFPKNARSKLTAPIRPRYLDHVASLVGEARFLRAAETKVRNSGPLRRKSANLASPDISAPKSRRRALMTYRRLRPCSTCSVVIPIMTGDIDRRKFRADTSEKKSGDAGN